MKHSFLRTSFAFILSAAPLQMFHVQAAIHKNKKSSDNILNAERTRDVVVAIIDTGADIQHKDLRDSVWINQGEVGLDVNGNDKSTNGIDDDGNGYIDDVHGWNFVDNTNRVNDREGHGTHIAGVIKSEFEKQTLGYSFLERKQQQQRAIASQNEITLKLMILKYYDANVSNETNLKNTVKAIEYAVKMNAQIINYSAGGAEPDSLEYQAIKKAQSRGVFLVTAAGNERTDADVVKYYPASYGLSNIIAVAALESDGTLASFSNYGKNTVDLAAPGSLVLSTLPNDRYGVLSGTSQATAYVSGYLASLIKRFGVAKKAISADESLFVYKRSLMNEAVLNDKLRGRTKNQLALVNGL
ncbi:MAG: S8 family peptidase [Pseudobdellovibrio sp.]